MLERITAHARRADRHAMERGSHALSRAPLVAALAIAGAVGRCAAPAPPERTVESVAEMLGRSVDGTVAAEDFVWEGRRGLLRDLLLGRDVLFTAAPRDGGPKDLYRARVRVGRSGRPIAVEAARNLTRTALGDDRDLIARGNLAAFATSVGGGIHGVTLLDLSGDAPPSGPWYARLLARAERFARTGSVRGVGRIDVAFAVPPSEVRLDVAGGQLLMALGAEAVAAALDPSTGDLNTGPRNVYSAQSTRRVASNEAPSPVLERMAQRWIGQGAARLVIGATSAVASLQSSLRAVPRPTIAPPLPPPADGPEMDGAWPPPSTRGDAAWSPMESAAFDAGTIVERVVEPDGAPPSEWVHVVAMDMRRLALSWVAGTGEPRSLGGPGGSGRVPDPARVVAAWAGGPGSDRALGAVFERRLLAAPAAGSIVAWADAGGRTRLGPWPAGGDPAQAVWLRQLGRSVDPDPGDRGIPVARAAMCRTEAGHLVYAWSPRARAATLERALSPLGCSAALLASHPSPVGLVVRNGPDSMRPAGAGTTFDAGRLDASSHDVFFVTPRDPRPGPGWEPDGGAQPPPSSLAAVHAREVELLGAKVRLTSFAPGRFRWLLRAGGRELRHRAGGAFPKTLPDGAAPVAGIGLAAGRRRAPRGLAIDGSTGLPVRGELGALVVDRAGELAIVPPEGVKAAWSGDATELPLTAEDARLLPEGREIGSLRQRAAACLLDDGTFVVAQTRFDSDEATTEALLDAGCKRVVALDRGDHQDAFVERAGTSPPLQDKHDATTLFALPAVMKGTVLE